MWTCCARENKKRVRIRCLIKSDLEVKGRESHSSVRQGQDPEMGRDVMGMIERRMSEKLVPGQEETLGRLRKSQKVSAEVPDQRGEQRKPTNKTDKKLRERDEMMELTRSTFPSTDLYRSLQISADAFSCHLPSFCAPSQVLD